jgi:hypothetical protein
MDEIDRGELDRAITKHVEWLRRRGVEVGVDPAQLTLPDVLYLLNTLDSERKPSEMRLTTSVLSSLRRLTALRGRKDGVERIRAEFEQKVSQIPRLAEEAPALRIVLDDAPRRALEPGMREYRRKSTTVLNGLHEFKRRHVLRAAGLKRLGKDGLALAETVRIARAIWLEGVIESALNEMDFFESEENGPVASTTFGHAGAINSRAWRRVRGECIRAISKAGGKAALRVQLFGDDSGPQEPALKKNRTRQRDRRAKKTEKSEA